jgi:tetratricopeptide (TPR) repeat protein
MQVVNAENVLGDFGNITLEQQGYRIRFFRRDDMFLVEMENREGELTEYEIAYTFGVDPLQQYLIGFPDGRYQALDMAWDSRPITQGGQRWFRLQPEALYEPGDPLHWTGTAYTWNAMCADCHSTNFEKNYDVSLNRYGSTFAEIDVACEACHGPGSAHMDWAAQVATASRNAEGPNITGGSSGLVVQFPRSADRSWLIDADTGLAHRVPESTSQVEIETCGRCHARRGAIVAEYGFDRPLTDSYRISLLERGLYHGDGQILDEVYVYGSFLQSRMYQEGVSCSDCHEPHSLRLYSQGNSLCNRCHLAERFDTPDHYRHEIGSEGAECISCHMTSETYMVVDPRRDHSFRVPRPDLSLRFNTPNACSTCHVSESASWAAEAIVKWYGPDRPASHFEMLASGRSGSVAAEAELRMLAGDSRAPNISRATALAALQGMSQASMLLINKALVDDSPLVRMGALIGLETADPVTLMRLVMPMLDDPDRSVRLEAIRLITTVPAQQVPSLERSDVKRAIAEYRVALNANSDRAQSHLGLGWLAMYEGDLVTAEKEYKKALELEPYFVPNFLNLADLYRLTGRDADGEALLKSALEFAPDNGDARYALGLLMVRLDRLNEAVEQLHLATQLAPGQPHYIYVYAVAVQTAGDLAGAIMVLDEGLSRFPEDRELLVGAAAFSRDLNDLDRAIAYVRRLVALDPNDAETLAFLRALELQRK